MLNEIRNVTRLVIVVFIIVLSDSCPLFFGVLIVVIIMPSIIAIVRGSDVNLVRAASAVIIPAIIMFFLVRSLLRSSFTAMRMNSIEGMPVSIFVLK